MNQIEAWQRAVAFRRIVLHSAQGTHNAFWAHTFLCHAQVELIYAILEEDPHHEQLESALEEVMQLLKQILRNFSGQATRPCREFLLCVVSLLLEAKREDKIFAFVLEAARLAPWLEGVSFDRLKENNAFAASLMRCYLELYPENNLRFFLLRHLETCSFSTEDTSLLCMIAAKSHDIRGLWQARALRTNELFFQNSLYWKYAENLQILCLGNTRVEFANSELSKALSVLPKETTDSKQQNILSTLYLRLASDLFDDNPDDPLIEDYLTQAEQLPETNRSALYLQFKALAIHKKGANKNIEAATFFEKAAKAVEDDEKEAALLFHNSAALYYDGGEIDSALTQYYSVLRVIESANEIDESLLWRKLVVCQIAKILASDRNELEAAQAIITKYFTIEDIREDFFSKADSPWGYEEKLAPDFEGFHLSSEILSPLYEELLSLLSQEVTEAKNDWRQSESPLFAIFTLADQLLQLGKFTKEFTYSPEKTSPIFDEVKALLIEASKLAPKETAAQCFHFYLRLQKEDGEGSEYIQSAEELFNNFPEELQTEEGRDALYRMYLKKAESLLRDAEAIEPWLEKAQPLYSYDPEAQKRCAKEADQLRAQTGRLEKFFAPPGKDLITSIRRGALLVSPDEMSAWSHGSIKEPQTIDPQTKEITRDGLLCQKIFGPIKDFQCRCGKYQGPKYRGVVCEICGVELIASSVRGERLGHIWLAAPIVHPWAFMKGAKSFLGLLLDIKSQDLLDLVNREKTFGRWDSDYPWEVVPLGEAHREYLHEDGVWALQLFLQELSVDEKRYDLIKEIQCATNQKKRRRMEQQLELVEALCSLPRGRPEYAILTTLPVLPPELIAAQKQPPSAEPLYSTRGERDIFSFFLNSSPRPKARSIPWAGEAPTQEEITRCYEKILEANRVALLAYEQDVPDKKTPAKVLQLAVEDFFSFFG
jgi:hypothetical protein